MKINIAVKNVDREIWLKFRAEAAMNDMKMGDFFAFLMKEHRAHEISDDITEIVGAAGHISGKALEKIEKTWRKERKS